MRELFESRLDICRAAKAHGQVLFERQPAFRHVGVQLVWVPVDLARSLHGLHRMIEAAFAEVAKRAYEVGNDFDVQRHCRREPPVDPHDAGICAAHVAVLSICREVVVSALISR